MKVDLCPVCRARLRENKVCPRCSTDLSLPLRIAAQAESLECQAIHHLTTGDLGAAQEAAAKAQQLRRSPLSRALLEFIGHTQNTGVQ